MRTHRVRLPLAAVAVGALAFQVAHTAEHMAQVAMWIAHPQRAPWMSSWAMSLSRWLGGIDVGRASETTLAMARGMEYLHLIGNAIFLAGLLAMGRLVEPGGRAAVWTRRATVVQGFHVAEHVLLVGTLVATGRSFGVSTWFGLLDGTQLSTHRVWWHGVINLVATSLAVMGAACWYRERRYPVAESPTVWRPLTPSLLGVVLAPPLTLALLVGQPVGSSASSDHADHAGHAGDAHSAMSDQTGAATPPGEIALVDVGASVGLDVGHRAFRWDVTMDPVAMMGGGVCWIDVDRDGWLDLFLTDTWSDGEWGLWNEAGALPTTRLFRNDVGRFVETTDDWSAGIETRANGCVVADLDGDGFDDLYITSSRTNVLLLNDAGRGFRDVSAASGTDAYGWHTGVAAGDLDLDGDIDLVVTGYADPNRSRPEASTGFPNTIEPIADLVLLNDGPGDDGVPRFRDVARLVGVEPDGPEYGLGTTLFDADGDGDLDLAVANDTQPNRLYLNEPTAGTPEFRLRDVASEVAAADDGSGMGVVAADLDGDLVDDVVVTNLAGQRHAARSGPGAFTPGTTDSFDAVRDVGQHLTGWGVGAGDLDLDGDLDLLVASGEIPITGLDASSSPLTLLTNRGSFFEDTTTASGLDQLPPRNGRATAFADYDNDGDLDVAVSAIGQPLVLLENRTTATQRAVVVDPGSMTPGVVVTATLTDGRVVRRSVVAGDGWLSSADHRVTIGLGDAAAVAHVEIRRPGGGICRTGPLAAGSWLVMAPGDLSSTTTSRFVPDGWNTATCD